MTRLILAALLSFTASHASMRLIVTVVEPKTGKPVEDLKAEDFIVLEDKLNRRVEAASFARQPIDVMLLLDTSLVGGAVQPVAQGLIGELKEKEQMAIVAFDASAEMIQDFTGSRQLLADSLQRVKYGNLPRVLDALFAAMDGGFENATFRRVILLVTTGYEGDSRLHERDVIRMARKQGVSIYPVYATGAEKGMMEELARRSGAASFSLREMQKSGGQSSIPGRIFDVLRAHYTVTISGNLGLGEKVKVEIKGREKDKLRVSALPID
jgi:VWFA-related protein